MPSHGECLYGRRPVVEVLRARRRAVHEILVLDTLRDADALELRELAQEQRLPVRAASARDLDQFTQGGHHQGVAAAKSAKKMIKAAQEEPER